MVKGQIKTTTRERARTFAGDVEATFRSMVGGVALRHAEKLHVAAEKKEKVLTDAGAAMLIEEKDLSPKSIKECAEEIFTQKEKAASLRRNIEKFAGAGAAEAIYKDMQELMSGEIIKNLIKEDAK